MLVACGVGTRRFDCAISIHTAVSVISSSEYMIGAQILVCITTLFSPYSYVCTRG
jgi:hypothetical protein